jgi:predicted LPLAT superfamily acyltransferase
VAKHIHCFAAVTLDRAYLLSESFRRFDVRTFGLEQLRQAWGRERGVLLLGSHLGSFDALRVLADFRSDITLRVVIDVEQNRRLSELLNALNPQLAKSIINARQEGTTTALAIKEALDEKALVTLLADRARPGNQVMTADFSRPLRALPHRAVAIGGGVKVPVVLCFGLYRGGNRYDLLLSETFAEQLKLDRAQRDAELQQTINVSPTGWLTTRAARRTIGSTYYDFWRADDSQTAATGDVDAAAGNSGAAASRRLMP